MAKEVSWGKGRGMEPLGSKRLCLFIGLGMLWIPLVVQIVVLLKVKFHPSSLWRESIGE